ncbi:VanZ family protein [Clostridium sp. AF15-41]|uniref:VanZ family protein n=1 Tax=Clostridium sp. AF15-41 TaxID=2292996 RepID=UPI000E70858F|nr:VanZ family protein [Clostridium sp. AF15-41]RJX00240.1 VanZ family protein [Clostridium sp. AF15-41]
MQKNYSTNKVKSTNINKAKNSGGSRTTNRKANKNTDKSANSKASSAKRKHNTADSKKRFLYLIPVIIWMVFIFYMSGKTGQESSGQSGKISLFITNLLEKVRQDPIQEMQNLQDILELVIRKTAHMTEYAILFLLSYLAMVKISMSQSRFYNRSIAVLISLLYACSDEMHQLLVPGRSGRMIDVGIDMAGVLIVLICMLLSKNTKWKIICGVLLGVLLVAAFVALLFVPF